MKDVQTLEIDGKEYILVDSISSEKKTYYYFSNESDVSDIQILTEKEENNEEYFISLDSEYEFNYALSLFFNKHKNDLTDKTTNN